MVSQPILSFIGLSSWYRPRPILLLWPIKDNIGNLTIHYLYNIVNRYTAPLLKRERSRCTENTSTIRPQFGRTSDNDISSWMTSHLCYTLQIHIQITSDYCIYNIYNLQKYVFNHHINQAQYLVLFSSEKLFRLFFTNTIKHWHSNWQ